MSNFNWALTKTLHHEGGFVDHPNDPGGATYRGISLRFLRANGEDIDADGDVDLDDVRALIDNPETVNGLYQQYFWTPNRLGEVRSELLSCKIFDMCVNMGSRQAWKIVQKASGRLVSDGIVGPKTLELLAEYEKKDWELLERIRYEQALFYRTLADRKPDLRVFLGGWLRRAAQ